MSKTNICTVCNERLPLEYFSIRGNTTALHRVCKACRRFANRVYYNKDRAEWCKEYYEKNRGKIKEYQKKYREENLDRRKEYEKEYQKKHKKSRKEYQREYYIYHKK